MDKTHFRRSDCRLCGSDRIELVLKLAPTPIADAYVSAGRLGEAQGIYPLDLFLCLSCGHLQLVDVIDPEVLSRDYMYVTSTSLGLVEHFRKCADEMMRRFEPSKGGLVVDIGSNDGSQLKPFEERGMRVLGIDPARKIAVKTTEAGIETLPAFFTADLAREIKNDRGPVAVVTANNVFAHVDNLAGVAEGVRHLLASDGIFAFEVSYLVDIIEKYLFDTVYHEHLCYHSVKPMDTFLRRHGLELIDVERILSKGGSLRCTAQPAGGPQSVAPSVSELIALEAKLGLDRAETFTAFAAKLDRMKAEVLDLLRDLKSKGKRVAGYGASHTVTTLIYHFELGGQLTFIVDDNPLKQNLYSPGHHIPVLSPAAIYDRKPDYVLVLAWQYAKPIIEKNQKYLEQGGHFIVPLPRLQVI